MSTPEDPQRGPEPAQAEPNATHLRLYQLKRRTRPHWPDTFEAAMQDPLIRRIIELDAAHGVTLVIRPSVQPRDLTDLFYESGSAPLDAISNAQPRREQAPAPRFIDNKSRAAGERDED